MEVQINRLEAQIKKVQGMFNKDLEEMKNRQSTMKKKAIIEIKNMIEGTNSNITRTEECISELEDTMVETMEAENNNEKRIKIRFFLDLLRGFWDKIKEINI